MKDIHLHRINILRKISIAVLAIALFSHCDLQEGSTWKIPEYTMTVKNPSSSDYSDYLLEISSADLSSEEDLPGLGNFIVMQGEEEVASQYSDDKLYILIENLKSGEEKQLQIVEGKPATTYEKRTQAELSVKTGGHFENRKYIDGNFKNILYLRVPDEHTDHSYYIRYEGPGWESDLVGYRFYLDWRNATDVFGKKTPNMVLHRVGLDGFDSYHEMQEWGVDVLKVGSSLGIGSLGMYVGEKAIRIDKTDSVTCEIVENGAVRSAIKTNYYGWAVDENTYNIESVLSIHAGTRLTKHQVKINQIPDNICTGLGKDGNARLYTDQGNGNKWGYLATYGKQSLNNDNLGLAVLFSSKDYKGFTEDEHSHIVKLNVEGARVEYYFLAAWEGEHNGIATEAEFLNYVQETVQNLSTPLTIIVAPN